MKRFRSKWWCPGEARRRGGEKVEGGGGGGRIGVRETDLQPGRLLLTWEESDGRREGGRAWQGYKTTSD